MLQVRWVIGDVISFKEQIQSEIDSQICKLHGHQTEEMAGE